MQPTTRLTVSRCPSAGVSIASGKVVLLRLAADRYRYTLINGKVMSTDWRTEAVKFAFMLLGIIFGAAATAWRYVLFVPLVLFAVYVVYSKYYALKLQRDIENVTSPLIRRCLRIVSDLENIQESMREDKRVGIDRLTEIRNQLNLLCDDYQAVLPHVDNKRYRHLIGTKQVKIEFENHLYYQTKKFKLPALKKLMLDLQGTRELGKTTARLVDDVIASSERLTDLIVQHGLFSNSITGFHIVALHKTLSSSTTRGGGIQFRSVYYRRKGLRQRKVNSVLVFGAALTMADIAFILFIYVLFMWLGEIGSMGG